MSYRLTSLEEAVLRKLLAGDLDALQVLRAQLTACRVLRREFSGTGFFTTLAVSQDVDRVDGLDTTFDDVLVEIEGLAHGAGFLLYVRDGTLDMLEGYSYDEAWPESVEEFQLRYADGVNRDWEKIGRMLSKRR